VDAAALSLKEDYFDEAESKSMCTRSNAFAVLRSFTPGCRVPSAPAPEAAFAIIGLSNDFTAVLRFRRDFNGRG